MVLEKATQSDLRFYALDKVITTVHSVKTKSTSKALNLEFNTSVKIYGHSDRMHRQYHFM